MALFAADKAFPVVGVHLAERLLRADQALALCILTKYLEGIAVVGDVSNEGLDRLLRRLARRRIIYSLGRVH